MTNSITRQVTVGICESQPLVVAGLRSTIQNTGEYRLVDASRSLEDTVRMLVTFSPTVVFIDKAFGTSAVSEFLVRWSGATSTAFIVWGTGITEPEAVRFLKSGARGIVSKTAETGTILSCLESVVSGQTWMHDSLFQPGLRSGIRVRSELTAREQQVLELVEQGLRNKDIAGELGICPGTVKIHLKHIFEKTGVRGRYGLALNSLQHQRTYPTAVAV